MCDYRRLRRSRDTWRAWTLTLVMVLFVMIAALVAHGW